VRLLAICLCVLALSGAALAQDSPPVIDAANVQSLASAARIDFASAPPEAGRIESGGFALSPDGARLALRNREDSIVIWSIDGELVDTFAVIGGDDLPDTVLDSAFNADGSLLAAIVSEGVSYTIAVRDIASRETTTIPFPNSPDSPLRVWFSPDSQEIWLEVTPAEPGKRGYVMWLPLTQHDIFATVASGPDNDPDAFARVGRVTPPLAVTSSQDGVVKLWDLRTGEATATAQVEGMAVFGGLNANATHFAWRDENSSALHLLDFQTGEDRIIAELDGAYINYVLLSPAADVILGVHVGGEPHVIAWDVAAGTSFDLGEYRPCNRTPDMARLSRDGMTLVIGCDTGIDIWRIQ
jgi:WD40 repeat protein